MQWQGVRADTGRDYLAAGAGVADCAAATLAAAKAGLSNSGKSLAIRAPLSVEQELGSNAVYAGKEAFYNLLK